MAKKDKKAAAEEAERPEGPAPTPRLLEKYEKEILPALAEKVRPRQPHVAAAVAEDRDQHGRGQGRRRKEAPGRGRRGADADHRPEAAGHQGRKAIANFKLREGLPIGCKVTLRGARMCEFLDRLISLALPRVRDFRGLDPNAFDGHGNYSLGLTEQLVFPELNPDKFTRVQGMNVTMVISGHSDDEARELLRGLGMPFKADETQRAKRAPPRHPET